MIRITAPILALIFILLIQAPSNAQLRISDNTPGSIIIVEFSVYFTSLQLALDTWDDEKEPDSVKIAAYKRASGYLAGIPFHYENNRQRMTINEQVDEYANEELAYNGYERTDSGYFQFDYTLSVSSDIYNASRRGNPVQGNGISDLEEEVPAREDARLDALRNAARAAIRAEYTEKNKPVPGIVDGRIMWNDIVDDQVDPESGLYTYNIEAWVVLDTN